MAGSIAGGDGGADNIRELHRVYPQLKDVPVLCDWSGPIDCTAEHLPVFGHLKDHANIFYAMGFNGTGIAQTPVAGRIMASSSSRVTTRGAGAGWSA
jgi:glycine/D-amino acid oxidase-like deaminating enzyme